MSRVLAAIGGALGISLVLAASAGAVTFSNTAGVTGVTCASQPCAAGPYPSVISASELSGQISDVNVTLTVSGSLTNIDVALLAPNGQSLVLASEAGDMSPTGAITFDDDAAGASALNVCGAPPNAPRVNALQTDDFGACGGPESDPFAHDASLTADPRVDNLSSLNGGPPNGSWKLYVMQDVDCASSCGGFFLTGWSVEITTEPSTPTFIFFTPGESDPSKPPAVFTPNPPASHDRDVSIAYGKKKGDFHGKLTSDEDSCIGGQKVAVFRKRKGDDARVGSNKTGTDGKWKVHKPDASGHFYANVSQAALSNGDSCVATKSKQLDVG